MYHFSSLSCLLPCPSFPFVAQVIIYKPFSFFIDTFLSSLLLEKVWLYLNVFGRQRRMITSSYSKKYRGYYYFRLTICQALLFPVSFGPYGLILGISHFPDEKNWDWNRLNNYLKVRADEWWSYNWYSSYLDSVPKAVSNLKKLSSFH